MNATTKTATAALATAKQLTKEGYGPCTIIRVITQRYPHLTRAEVLDIAKAVKINPATASTQYQQVRSGNIVVEAL